MKLISDYLRTSDASNTIFETNRYLLMIRTKLKFAFLSASMLFHGITLKRRLETKQGIGVA